MSPPNTVRSSAQYERLTNLCSPGWRMQRHAVGCNMARCCQTTTSHRVAQRQSTPKPCYQGSSSPTRESNAQPVLFSSSTHWQHPPQTHTTTWNRHQHQPRRQGGSVLHTVCGQHRPNPHSDSMKCFMSWQAAWQVEKLTHYKHTG